MPDPTPSAASVEEAKEIVYEIRATLDKFHVGIVALALDASRKAGVREAWEKAEQTNGSVAEGCGDHVYTSAACGFCAERRSAIRAFKLLLRTRAADARRDG